MTDRIKDIPANPNPLLNGTSDPTPEKGKGGVWRAIISTLKGVFGVLLLAAAVNCGPIPAPQPPTPQPPTPEPPQPPVTLSFDLVACKSPFIDNYCDGPAGAVFAVEVATNVWKTFAGDGNGYTWASGIPNVPNSRLKIVTPGYQDVFVAIAPPTLVAVNAKGVHNVWQVQPDHVDPSAIPLKTLAAIRGAMWPQTLGACGNLSSGPRPGQDSNIIATVFITEYSQAEQKCIVGELRRRGYTHVVMGPLVDSDGYHGVWTPNDWRGQNFDRFLDAVQFFWDNGLAPVVFIHPDGWDFGQTQSELTSLLQQPRAQKLIRLAVGSGWEPAGYNWSSCTWTQYAQWVRTTLPNALSLIHNAVKPDGSPYDAFVGTDALCDDNGKPNGEGWSRIAPYLHGFLIQYDLFSGNTTPQSNPSLASNFAAQYMADGAGADAHGFRWHFVHGISGWPTFSAWGPSTPLSLYYGEGTAYGRFWQGMTEATGVAWGDWSITWVGLTATWIVVAWPCRSNRKLEVPMSVNQPHYSIAEREALSLAAQAVAPGAHAKVPYPNTLFVRKDDAQAVKAKIDAENDRLRLVSSGGGCDVAGYSPVQTPAAAPSFAPWQLREVYREKAQMLERERENLRSQIQDLDARTTVLTSLIDLLR